MTERRHRQPLRDMDTANKPVQSLPRTPFPRPEKMSKQKRSQSLFTVDQETADDFRQRSFSWPSQSSNTDWRSEYKDENSLGDKRIIAVMANAAHIVIGMAMTQLGIVGTWYQRYMNFNEDQLRHVIYICVLFIILGVYGVCLVVKRLENVKSHRVAYITMSTLSTVASCFIVANGIRLIAAESYRKDETVVVIFDGLMLALGIIELPAILVGSYCVISKPSVAEKKEPTSEGDTKSSSWWSIFSMILNVAHIVLGLCITELGMVGMTYRNIMNVDSAGLFAVVFVSLSFISVGVIGIYNQMTGKGSTPCNRSVYTVASVFAVACAAMIMSVVSMAMDSKHYYTGIEAIVAFDVMILGMSSVELIVAMAAIAICLIPICTSKLGEQGSRSKASLKYTMQ